MKQACATQTKRSLFPTPARLLPLAGATGKYFSLLLSSISPHTLHLCSLSSSSQGKTATTGRAGSLVIIAPDHPSQSHTHLITASFEHIIRMSTNTESNFRNAFKSFGARGGVAATDNATSGPGGAFGQASTWFSGVRTQVSGYVPVSLGGSGGAPQEEDWLGLSWFQRMAGFAICVAGGVACFMVAFFIGLPLLVLNPAKFATSFTFGSLLLMTSFALLKGPMAHVKALISKERLPFTAAYFGSMLFTLYASLGANSYFLTIIGTIIQILALVYYFTSYSPFNAGSIRLGSRMASGLLPV